MGGLLGDIDHVFREIDHDNSGLQRMNRILMRSQTKMKLFDCSLCVFRFACWLVGWLDLCCKHAISEIVTESLLEDIACAAFLLHSCIDVTQPMEVINA